MTAMLRARRVLRELGLDEPGQLERAQSVANEVWLLGGFVLRISAHTTTHRLEYEAAVVDCLPPEVHYPDIVAYGRTGIGEWLVCKRASGQVLSRAWPTMRESERRSAVTQLAEILKAVHATAGPVDEDGQPLIPPFLANDTLECPHQLPPTRLQRLLGEAATMPFVDVRVIEEARRLVKQTASALDPGAPTTLIHGDLHFENVLWDGERITAVLDFEYSRRAPADLDLDVLLRFCADPELHVASDYSRDTGRDDYRDVPRWLREAYPELFAAPRLLDRLTLYALSYDVRHLLLQPPTRPADQLPPHHPWHRVRRLVEGRTHLQWMDLGN